MTERFVALCPRCELADLRVTVCALSSGYRVMTDLCEACGYHVHKVMRTRRQVHAIALAWPDEIGAYAWRWIPTLGRTLVKIVGAVPSGTIEALRAAGVFYRVKLTRTIEARLEEGWPSYLVDYKGTIDIAQMRHCHIEQPRF